MRRIELIRHQRFDQKTGWPSSSSIARLEIAYKDFLINERPPLPDSALAALFQVRHAIETEIQKYVTFSASLWRN